MLFRDAFSFVDDNNVIQSAIVEIAPMKFSFTNNVAFFPLYICNTDGAEDYFAVSCAITLNGTVSICSWNGMNVPIIEEQFMQYITQLDWDVLLPQFVQEEYDIGTILIQQEALDCEFQPMSLR